MYASRNMRDSHYLLDASDKTSNANLYSFTIYSKIIVNVLL